MTKKRAVYVVDIIWKKILFSRIKKLRESGVLHLLFYDFYSAVASNTSVTSSVTSSVVSSAGVVSSVVVSESSTSVVGTGHPKELYKSA